ncbi:MAG: signal peptidase II, partial [Pseudomonadota bacterium]|nr:signal peptidase II [Pseudomonadota bacterium]
DFVDLHAGGYHWPAFNIADAAIFCGVVMLIVENLWPSRHDDQEHRA